MQNDPWQIHNLTNDLVYAKVFKELCEQLTNELKASDNTLVTGGEEKIDRYSYKGWRP